MITAQEKSYIKQLRKNVVIANGANMDFAFNQANMGDSVEIKVRGSVTMSSWTGGDLSAAENIQELKVKAKIEAGKQVHFKFREADLVLLEKDPDRIKDYTNDVNKQFAVAIDTYLGLMYPQAGITVGSSSSPVQIDEDSARRALIYMKNQFDVANIPLQDRVCYLPSIWVDFLKLDDHNFTTEQGRKDSLSPGYRGDLDGWEINESQCIYNSSDIYYPLFTVKKQSYCLGVPMKLKLQSYIPDLSLDTAFKGGGMYGGKVYDARKFGTMVVTFGDILTV